MRQFIRNLLFKNLLGAVILDDIIKLEKGVVYIGGKPASENEIRQLLAEIKALETSRLWQILNETVKNDAVDRGWNKSTNLEHLNTAKTIFYALDLQSSIIKIIKTQDKKKHMV